MPQVCRPAAILLLFQVLPSFFWCGKWWKLVKYKHAEFSALEYKKGHSQPRSRGCTMVLQQRLCVCVHHQISVVVLAHLFIYISWASVPGEASWGGRGGIEKEYHNKRRLKCEARNIDAPYNTKFTILVTISNVPMVRRDHVCKFSFHGFFFWRPRMKDSSSPHKGSHTTLWSFLHVTI